MALNETSEAPPSSPGVGTGLPPGAPTTASPARGPGAGEAVATAEARRAHFQPLAPSAAGGEAARDNIGLLLDVVVTVTVELGGSSLPLRDVLTLAPGSVVRLDRAIGEPVDILINRELVGRGEVVVVDDRFGVRVTELHDPQEAAP